MPYAIDIKLLHRKIMYLGQFESHGRASRWGPVGTHYGPLTLAGCPSKGRGCRGETRTPEEGRWQTQSPQLYHLPYDVDWNAQYIWSQPQINLVFMPYPHLLSSLFFMEVV